MTPFCAAVDWGTSSFRLWLLARDGAVLAERRSDEGMMAAMETGFEAILERHLAAAGGGAALPVIVCGMAGAKQGWREAGYLDAPAMLDDVPAGAVRVDVAGHDIRILPGIAQRDTARPDVMRGEETQLLGLARRGAGSGLVCMPGTHSKWVVLSDGVVERFSTFMTGEMFAILKAHSILRLTIGGDDPIRPADAAFARGVKTAFATPQEIANHLFSLRAGPLLGLGGMEGGAAGLSGLLIGLELAGARSSCGTFDAVTLVAEGPLGELYRSALATIGARVSVVEAHSVARHGLWCAATAIWG